MRPMIGSSQSGRSAPKAMAAMPRAMTTAPCPSAYSVPSLIGLDLLAGEPRSGRWRRANGRGDGRARPGPASWARISPRAAVAMVGPGHRSCCSSWAASATPAAAVVLVMSVIAAMWSQSMPWRRPSGETRSAARRSRRGGGDLGDDVEQRTGLAGGAWTIQGRPARRISQHVASAARRGLSSYTSHDDADRIDRPEPTPARPWDGVPDRLRARGLRWTPQRRILVEVLSTDRRPRHRRRAGRALSGDRSGHDPVDRVPDARRPRGARRRQPQPRRRWSRGVPRPARRPSTATCTADAVAARRSWPPTTRPSVAALRAFAAERGFEIDVSHLTLIGRARCAGARRRGERVKPDPIGGHPADRPAGRPDPAHARASRSSGSTGPSGTCSTT